MKPSPFTLHRPSALPEALDVLARVGADGKVLAGGQSLIPLLSMRLAAPAHLVDVNAVPGLDAIEVADREVRVGALVRHTALLQHPAARDDVPLLGQALQHVAHPTIRNRGTSVGSIVHADPSAELPAVLTLLGGRVVAKSVRGEREIAAAELFAGPLESSLEPDELAVAAVFPRPRPGTGSAALEVARRHGDYAVAGVVTLVELGPDGGVASARAAYVSAGELGTLVDLTEAAAGRSVTDRPGDWEPVGRYAAEQVEVDGDIHASAAYRRHLVQVLTARAVQQAAREAARQQERINA
jgi:carbon-monoxide dehydrogenase medium subunit